MNRPILFSGPMVRALLEGRKTQTRRIVKPQPELSDRVGFVWTDRKGKRWACGLGLSEGGTERNFLHKCPYGQPGDLLWVRETWYCDDYRVQRGPYLKPDDMNVSEAQDDGMLIYRASAGDSPYEQEQPTWRSPIHMPRWASRLTLRITDVRVQRLQEISDDDCDAECFAGDFPHNVLPHLFPDADKAGFLSIPQCYGRLWDSINGAGGWDANPWVWALTFDVIEANVDEVLKGDQQ